MSDELARAIAFLGLSLAAFEQAHRLRKEGRVRGAGLVWAASYAANITGCVFLLRWIAS
jgi:hypothetical protein